MSRSAQSEVVRPDAARSPAGVRAPRAGASAHTQPIPEPTTTPNPSSWLASSVQDELAAAIQNLRIRGVGNPEQFAPLGSDAINGTLRWFDSQQGRVGAGVLVHELRAGGKPGWTPTGRERRHGYGQWDREYAQQITAWIARHFPDLVQPGGGAHPAAFAAVLKLHWKHGRGTLTVREHGEYVRRCVEVFERRAGRAGAVAGA